MPSASESFDHHLGAIGGADRGVDGEHVVVLAQIASLQTNRGEEETRRLQPEIAGVREEPAERCSA